jgi:hypothetical protein
VVASQKQKEIKKHRLKLVSLAFGPEGFVELAVLFVFE